MCARSSRQHLAREVRWDHPLRQAAYWQTYLGGAPTLTCEHCGKGFKSKLWNCDPPKFCSRKCKGLGDARKLQPKPCEWCGTEFQPAKGRSRFCMPSCASLFNIKKFRDTAPERNCTVCGTTFRPGSQNSAFCSKACKMLEVNAKRRAYKARRRAASGFICEAAE
jgi:predicted nucleic acid-binding Zn ribbon protein